MDRLTETQEGRTPPAAIGLFTEYIPSCKNSCNRVVVCLLKLSVCKPMAFVLGPAARGINRPHPTLLMEPGALMACAKVSCSYQLSAEVLQNNGLSSAQIEAVALCCEQHERMFGKYRHGFLVGEGPGTSY